AGRADAGRVVVLEAEDGPGLPGQPRRTRQGVLLGQVEDGAPLEGDGAGAVDRVAGVVVVADEPAAGLHRDVAADGRDGREDVEDGAGLDDGRRVLGRVG